MFNSNLIGISANNYLNSEEIVAVLGINSECAKSIYSIAKKNGTLLNLTKGRSTKSVIILKNGMVVASPLKTLTTIKKCSSEAESEDKYADYYYAE